MTDREQIKIDGVDVSKCICCLRICTTTKKPEAICNEYAYCSQTPNCYFKQLARKTQELYSAQNEVHFKTEYIQEQRDIIKKLEQECEELKEKYEVLRLENEEGYEIFAELKHECKEQEDKIKKLRKNLALEIELTDRYRNVLEEIEEIVSKDYYGDTWADISIKLDNIRNIINKAKGSK